MDLQLFHWHPSLDVFSLIRRELPVHLQVHLLRIKQQLLFDLDFHRQTKWWRWLWNLTWGGVHRHFRPHGQKRLFIIVSTLVAQFFIVCPQNFVFFPFFSNLADYGALGIRRMDIAGLPVVVNCTTVSKIVKQFCIFLLLLPDVLLNIFDLLRPLFQLFTGQDPMLFHSAGTVIALEGSILPFHI